MSNAMLATCGDASSRVNHVAKWQSSHCRCSTRAGPARVSAPSTTFRPCSTPQLRLLELPMRILTRYVLFDLLKVFLLTLTGLTLLIFIVLIGKEAVDKGIGLGPLLRMAPYLIPQAMQFAVPGTMLLATTSVYGRMASYNEIVAIKSLGISPMALIWPTLDPGDAGELRRRGDQRRRRELGHDGRAARVSGIDRGSDLRPTADAAHVQPGQSEHHGPRRRRPPADLADADRASVAAIEPAWTVSAEGSRTAAYCRRKASSSSKFHDFELDGPIKYNDPGHIRVRDVGRGIDRLDAEEPQPVDLCPGRNRAGHQGARAGRSPASSRPTSRRPPSAC